VGCFPMKSRRWQSVYQPAIMSELIHAHFGKVALRINWCDRASHLFATDAVRIGNEKRSRGHLTRELSVSGSCGSLRMPAIRPHSAASQEVPSLKIEIWGSRTKAIAANMLLWLSSLIPGPVSISIDEENHEFILQSVVCQSGGPAI